MRNIIFAVIELEGHDPDIYFSYKDQYVIGGDETLSVDDREKIIDVCQRQGLDLGEVADSVDGCSTEYEILFENDNTVMTAKEIVNLVKGLGYENYPAYQKEIEQLSAPEE